MRAMHNIRTTIATVAASATLILGAGACSSRSPSKVASLAKNGSSSSSGASDTKQSFRDAMLDYSKCMRAHGVDMPDPTFDDSGGGMGVIMQGGGDPSKGPPNEAAFKSAETACKPILDAAQKDAPRPSPEQEAKMRDQALKFAQCMRGKGLDVPDPTFDNNGGMKIESHAAGGGPSSSNGPTTGGPDPAFQQAAKDCSNESGGPGIGAMTSVNGDK
jgi:hypothetical protein